MFRDVIIRPNELGLRFREGNFIGPVGPGRHTLFVPPWDTAAETIEVLDLRRRRFLHPRLEELVQDSELRELLVVAEVGEGEQGLVWLRGEVIDTLGPGLHAFWQDAAEPLRIEVVAGTPPGGWRVWGQIIPGWQETAKAGPEALAPAACA